MGTEREKEVITLGGGCFWCLQPIFQDLKGVDKVEVMLTLETRDPEHRDDAVKALRARGFTVELQG